MFAFDTSVPLYVLGTNIWVGNLSPSKKYDFSFTAVTAAGPGKGAFSIQHATLDKGNLPTFRNMHGIQCYTWPTFSGSNG